MEDHAYYETATEPTCDCTNTEIRVRIIAGGGEHWVRQCLRCGRPSPPMSKRDIPLQALRERKPFDRTLRDAWDAKVSDYFKRRHEYTLALGEAERREKDSAWWIEYNAYLRTPEWAEKRRRVIQRDPVCKGCGVNRSTQAHHLTYEHRFNEFLFELVGVCEPCHKRLHFDDGSGLRVLAVR